MRRRTLARTAVVGGAAYYAVRRGTRGREKDAAPSAQDASDPIEQIKQLNELRGQGMLTDEEFTAEKKKLLGL
jgi:hypothetical protein